ncbi:cytochrome c (plasmid) [Peteryoungia desertarenae]|uniref:Cytochrome c n=1 Tax=Peteryoungia desertarenae TaxID=1813451 RepID=A0ABX6QSP5_9HYPH|nr:cytochrome c [Peteryoungia desertarenae]QLF71616.1 cytochrome c [Peteryoungia desertarenae]
MKRSPVIFGIAIGAIGVILVGLIVWLTIVYAGLYNVAATDDHADVVRWSFDRTMERSIRRQAVDIDLPENPPEDVIAEGARHYAESCVYCHGAPGEDPTDWSRGMRPEPPHLAEAASEWTTEEIHWIVTNGIKMTGMPSFAQHSPEEINAIVAFVDALPGLTVEDYARLTNATGSSGQTAAPPVEGEAAAP